MARAGEAVVPSTADFGSPYKFDVEAGSPPINSPAGSAPVANSQVWPVLSDLSMFSLKVSERGMREPHWHPGTAEMGYVERVMPG